MLSLYTGLTTWWADLKERLSEDRGATAVEYALMVALIAVVIILAVTFIGTSRFFCSLPISVHWSGGFSAIDAGSGCGVRAAMPTMRADARAFLTYYAWQVFVRTPTGVRRLTGPGHD